MEHLKIAFTGTSGSGKTTLVKHVAENLGIEHISGSAWDLKNKDDKSTLRDAFGFPGGGHAGVMKYSALNPEYGVYNQNLLLQRRAELSRVDKPFVTDRSPIDNIAYFLLQCAYHPLVSDFETSIFIEKAFLAMGGFSHIIHIKAVQPGKIEDNQSRIANKAFQQSMDAVFSYWIHRYQEFAIEEGIGIKHPRILVIDFWDLILRQQRVLNFIKYGN